MELEKGLAILSISIPECPKNQRPQYGPQLVGLSLSGHPQKEPPNVKKQPDQNTCKVVLHANTDRDRKGHSDKDLETFYIQRYGDIEVWRYGVIER